MLCSSDFLFTKKLFSFSGSAQKKIFKFFWAKRKAFKNTQMSIKTPQSQNFNPSKFFAKGSSVTFSDSPRVQVWDFKIGPFSG